MKISWNNLKVSIAGAKLSHLVPKDKIWDHGSMVEQVKTIFFKLQRAKNAGEIENLKKYLTTTCFEKLKREMDELEEKRKAWIINNPVIKEIAVIEVHPSKNNKPDSFIALIKGKGVYLITDKEKNVFDFSDHIHDFNERWGFTRQGDWWLLDGIQPQKIFI